MGFRVVGATFRNSTLSPLNSIPRDSLKTRPKSNRSVTISIEGDSIDGRNYPDIRFMNGPHSTKLIPRLRYNRTTPKQILASLYYLIVVFVSAVLLGSMIHGNLSPWVWEEYRSEVLRHGHRDALLTCAAYVIFYSGTLTFPYLIIRETAIVVINPHGRTHARNVMHGINAGAFLVSTGICLTTLVFLPAILAFWANLPTDVWNGWLFILSIPVSAFLIFAGIVALINEKKSDTLVKSAL